MKIALIAPLYESVPPKLYGGTERVVAYLADELVNLGHDVTLFASGDSKTKAKLVASCQQALRLNKDVVDPLVSHFVQLYDVIHRADEFDILHFNIDYLHFPVSQTLKYHRVTTLHGRLDLPELQPLYKRYSKEPLVSISNNQRQPLPFANWIQTVYHGLPENLFHEGNGEENYLAFLGRISPEKGIEQAIEIAIRAGMKLKIAAKIDKADQEYYENKIARLFDHPLIEYIGEINEQQKQAFLGNATALLFPINWPEPFGMVMIEAMATGTPVIAFRNGSVPEVIDNRITGYIVANVEEAVNAISQLNRLSRKKIRDVFEKKYTATVMAKNYVAVYERIIQKMPGDLAGHEPTVRRMVNKDYEWMGRAHSQ